MTSFNLDFAHLVDNKWCSKRNNKFTPLPDFDPEKAVVPFYDVNTGVYKIYILRVGDKLYFDPEKYFYVPPFHLTSIAFVDAKLLPDWREYTNFIRNKGCASIHGVFARDSVPEKFVSIFQKIHDLFMYKYLNSDDYFNPLIEHEYGVWLALQLIKM